MLKAMVYLVRSYPAEGDFVCLEPWWALSDTLDTDGDFKTKYAINKLSGQQVFGS